MRKLIVVLAETVVATALLPTAVQASAATSASPPGAGYKCQVEWRNPSGGSWSTGSNWSTGSPPTPQQDACITVGAGAWVVLNGAGTARSLTLGSPGRPAAQLVLLDGTLTVGSLTNYGTIMTAAGYGTVKAMAGGLLVNAGSVLVPAGTLNIAGNFDNTPAGTIAIIGGAWLQGAVSLTNYGTISLAPNANLDTTPGSPQAIDNYSGTIANAGTITVQRAAKFVERSGTTTGNPVRIVGGAVDFEGPGASSFLDGGLIAGNISAGQTVDFWSGGGAVDHAAGSFTNYGLIGGPVAGTLVLPRGGTLTNEGTINELSWSLEGNFDNATTGVMYVPGEFSMLRQGSVFDNTGALYVPYAGTLYLNGTPGANQPSAETFDNTGALYLGVGAGGGMWGSFGLHSTILSYTGNKTFLGGKVVPLPWGEPDSWQRGDGSTIVYGVTAVSSSSYVIACPASVADGWSLQKCGPTLAKPGWAVLTDNQATTRTPTDISVTGSGAAKGTEWTSAYGQAVKLTAIVTAQAGQAPTGTVTFLDQVEATPDDELTPAVLGTAELRATGKTAVATVVTTRLAPESYMLLAVYSGDSDHLPASTDNYSGYLAQQVDPQATSVALTASPASAKPGSPVTFTATVTPGVQGPVSPTGEVEFINHSNGDVIAEAPVTTVGASSKAVVQALTTGVSLVVATYSGDYDYAGSSSPGLALPQK